MEKLIYKYLSGKANAEEVKRVREWILESEENMHFFAKIKNLYVISTIKEIDASEKDTEMFMNRIHKNEQRTRLVRIFRMSAAVAILFVFSFAVYQIGIKGYREELIFIKSQQIVQNHYYTPCGVKGKVVLPDSTVVWLNSSSAISYPSKFSGNFREVSFIGEGYFEVKKNPDRPMKILLNNGMTVSVKGTTFNLSAYENDKTVSLFLLSGHVSILNDKSKELLKVEPNQKISIDRMTNKISVLTPDDIMPTVGWKKGWLVFDEAEMQEIIKKVERWYGVRVVVLDSSIMSKTLTAKFREESISQVLGMMHQISLINYSLKDSTATLYSFK